MTEYTCDSFRFFNLFPVYFGGKGTESGVFQLSFCLSGCMEWEFEGGRGGKYAIAPTECSLQ